MGLKTNEIESGCFSRAEPDEPMFVLLGRDQLAPWLVVAWSWLRRCQIYIGFKPASDFKRCDEAAELARSMRAWRERKLYASKLPRALLLCDCQHPETTKDGFAAVSIDCPVHGERA